MVFIMLKVDIKNDLKNEKVVKEIISLFIFFKHLKWILLLSQKIQPFINIIITSVPSSGVRMVHFLSS